MSKRLSCLSFLLILAIATVAQAQHFDVFVATSGSDTVGGGFNLDTDEITVGNPRVFEAEMGDIGTMFIADEPGFAHPASDMDLPGGVDSLTMGDEIFVRPLDVTDQGMTAPLFFWSPADVNDTSVAFAPAATTTFNIRTDFPNQSIGTAGAGGGFDDHPFFELEDNGALPDVGIYLASFEHEVGGFGAAPQSYIVMGTEGLITADFLGITQDEFDMLSDDDIDEALEGVIELGVDYVSANIVPEPSALGLASLSVLALLMLRRRS
ncbi:MAG: hypothetical protein AAGF97_12195 [Planctomycetota bacterium]